MLLPEKKSPHSGYRRSYWGLRGFQPIVGSRASPTQEVQDTRGSWRLPPGVPPNSKLLGFPIPFLPAGGFETGRMARVSIVGGRRGWHPNPSRVGSRAPCAPRKTGEGRHRVGGDCGTAKNALPAPRSPGGHRRDSPLPRGAATRQPTRGPRVSVPPPSPTPGPPLTRAAELLLARVPDAGVKAPELEAVVARLPAVERGARGAAPRGGGGDGGGGRAVGRGVGARVGAVGVAALAAARLGHPLRALAPVRGEEGGGGEEQRQQVQGHGQERSAAAARLHAAARPPARPGAPRAKLAAGSPASVAAARRTPGRGRLRSAAARAHAPLPGGERGGRGERGAARPEPGARVCTSAGRERSCRRCGQRPRRRDARPSLGRRLQAAGDTVPARGSPPSRGEGEGERERPSPGEGGGPEGSETTGAPTGPPAPTRARG